jgi:hypothetical protein
MQRRERGEVPARLPELVKILDVIAHRIGHGGAFALAFSTRRRSR